MKPGLTPGIEKEVRFTVAEAMCPAFDGKVVHRVCSTWTLVHYMELAGRRVLVDYLEPDEEGVGSHASCDHLGPAPVGSEVMVRAHVTRADERELVCETTALRGAKVIARGLTIQRIFPREVLQRILKVESGF